MTERKPDPDNAPIDELERDGPAPSQGGSSGGDMTRDVGSRSELHNTAGETGIERPHGQDNQDNLRESKGKKTTARLDPANKA